SNDLYNAFHCAMDEKRYDLAQKYLYKNMDRGFQLELITKYYSGEDLKVLDSIIKLHIPDKSLFNQALSLKIKKLSEWDSGVRKHSLESRPAGNYMTDSVYRIDQIITDSLFSLFTRHGAIPNQDVIGNTRNDPRVSPNYTIIILHHVLSINAGHRNDVFDTLAIKGIFEFNYHPKWFAGDFGQRANPMHKDSTVTYNDLTVKFPLRIPINRLWHNIDMKDKKSTKYIK